VSIDYGLAARFASALGMAILIRGITCARSVVGDVDEDVARVAGRCPSSNRGIKHRLRDAPRRRPQA
jgi:hypothetical protein